MQLHPELRSGFPIGPGSTWVHELATHEAGLLPVLLLLETGDMKEYVHN